MLSRIAIFVQDPIRGKLSDILKLTYGALADDEMNHSNPPMSAAERLKDDIDRMRTDGTKWMEEAEDLIKRRLWVN